MVHLFAVNQLPRCLSFIKKKGKACIQQLSQVRDKVDSCLGDFHSIRQSILKLNINKIRMMKY